MPYEQIWKEKNRFGKEQTYKIALPNCEKVEVCATCHQPYVNVLGDESCSDCTRSPEQDDDEYPFYDGINQYGFPQTFQRSGDDTADIPVCAQCHACVMPNRGQGMICDACDHAFTIECQHDGD